MPEGRGETRSAPGGARRSLPPVVPAKIRVPLGPALPRERLESRLATAWRHRLTLIIAPAGSGKTTLAARFATSSGTPVGWYRAESWDADEASLVRHLEAALGDALPGLPRGWADVADAARALEAAPASAALLVVDDGHALEGTAAEEALGRFVEYAPPWLAILIAGRVPPAFNLSRLRVSGELLELGPEDLRFRAWEAERLFREVYQNPVPPADLAVLARRTEGWAAGLQLFHLATRGRSPEERRRVLGGVGGSGRLLREYLAQNVMFGLPDDLRRFLVDTCVLGRLTGALCDRLLGSSGSAARLEELARRGVFTVSAEDADDAYRYHEVLRGHLDRMLVEEVGELAARERHARAGRLLEDAGALPEALRAFCRAEDWDAVRRLLGGEGERLAEAGADGWIEAIPPAIERHDPWVALASARRARNDGRWVAAAEAYVRAEQAFAASRAADAPRRERLDLATWLDPAAIAPPNAVGALRAGIVREPGRAAASLAARADPSAPVARGLLLLAAGEAAAARRALVEAAEQDGVGPIASAAARLGAAVAGRLAGEAWDPGSFEAAVEAADRGGVPWLARLGRALAVWLSPAHAGPDAEEAVLALDGPAAARPAAGPGSDDGDGGWGRALVRLAAAWSEADPETALAIAEAAAGDFRRLGAGVPEAWARGIAALAAVRSEAPEAREAAVGAESIGRATGTAAVRMLAYDALGALDAGRREEYRALADAVRADTGLARPALAGEHAAIAAEPAAGRAQSGEGPGRIAIWTLGGCRLESDGRRVLLDAAKPRVRSLFRLLAVHAGAPVHREVIQDALWPEADASAGARSLHVAVSALRRLLDEMLSGTGGRLVARDGEAYRLDVAPEAVDVGRFEAAIADARAARARRQSALEPYARAAGLYAGELLPEEGPAEWVVERRDRYRAEAVEAAVGIAEEALLGGDHAAAIRACRFGLGLDRYQDALWRILIEAHERAGDPGAAVRERREYAVVLGALGLEPPVAVGPG